MKKRGPHVLYDLNDLLFSLQQQHAQRDNCSYRPVGISIIIRSSTSVFMVSDKDPEPVSVYISFITPYRASFTEFGTLPQAVFNFYLQFLYFVNFLFWPRKKLQHSPQSYVDVGLSCLQRYDHKQRVNKCAEFIILNKLTDRLKHDEHSPETETIIEIS